VISKQFKYSARSNQYTKYLKITLARRIVEGLLTSMRAAAIARVLTAAFARVRAMAFWRM
jgi:hypothetical protein